MQMHFLAEQSGVGDRVWIHPSGQLAALVDGVSGCENPALAAETCIDFLASQDAASLRQRPEELIQALSRFLARKQYQAVLALVVMNDAEATCYWVGNPSLTLFTGEASLDLLGDAQAQPLQVLGQSAGVHVKSLAFPVGIDQRCVLASDGLSSEMLKASHDRVVKARSRSEWQCLAADCAADRDWSLLVFPIESQFSFARSSWPYNPFVGPQEDRAHERRGLAALADAFFRDPDHEGFRIFGGLQLPRADGSRLPDGVLVSPWGVVLLELKDHGDCDVELPLFNRNVMVVREKDGLRTEGNPVAKMRESLRTFQNISLGGGEWDESLRRLGAVVFTHDRVTVCAIDEQGQAQLMPVKTGEVLVVRPQDLPNELKQYVRRKLGKKARRPLADFLPEIVQALHGPAAPEQPTPSMRRIGDYQITAPLAAESSDYYQTFAASHPLLGDVWIKTYDFSELARGARQQEIQRIGREVFALKRLANDQVDGIQQSVELIPEEGLLHVVVGRAPDTRLDTWLAGTPDRGERWQILADLAEILEGLAGNQVIHRALTPANVRIGRRGKVQLINFELCQMNQLATLPMSGRRALDVAYVAPEANVPGRPVTPAADMYSFGRLLTLVMSGKLPFENYEDQRMAQRRPGFWEAVASACGLPGSEGAILENWLNQNPARRPTASEARKRIHAWQML